VKQYRAILDDSTALIVLASTPHEARSIAFGQLVLVWMKTGRMAMIREVVEA
jgi:hypothetical protein